LHGGEGGPDLGLAVLRYERQDQIDVVGFECPAGGGDDGAVE
jgi:hypothetical protein